MRATLDRQRRQLGPWRAVHLRFRRCACFFSLRSFFFRLFSSLLRSGSVRNPPDEPRPALKASETSPDQDQKAKLRAVLGMDSPQPGHPDKPARAVRTPEPAGEGPSALSTWLTRTRLSKKLTVAELAQKWGLSGPAIYNIESGRIANPRVETTRRLEKALGVAVPAETKNEVREEAEIEGVGELQDFDPHDDDDRPSVSGVYVLYDVAERPIYVGEGANIKRRIRDHHEKFWFKSPIVETAAYVKIDEERLRRKVEAVLIRFLKSNAVINKKNVDR